MAPWQDLLKGAGTVRIKGRIQPAFGKGLLPKGEPEGFIPAEKDVLRSCALAFAGGYTTVKLYFMLGLPTEMDEDIRGITELARKVVDLFYSMPSRPKGKVIRTLLIRLSSSSEKLSIRSEGRDILIF